MIDKWFVVQHKRIFVDMKRILAPFLIIFLLACSTMDSQKQETLSETATNNTVPQKQAVVMDTIPLLLQQLITAYPAQKFRATATHLIWQDGEAMLFDDGKIKDFGALLQYPDLQDQLALAYTPTQIPLDTPLQNQDPGRIRVEAFFRKMYGDNPTAVANNLKTIEFFGQKVRVTTINGVDEKLERISHKLLQQETKWSKYLQNIGGTFHWRKIAGTDRLSMHSFGMTLDINVRYADYWRWQARGQALEEHFRIAYRNRIPLEIVQIFEAEGFIWGGKWYHYDTMHFEYRPELLSKRL